MFPHVLLALPLSPKFASPVSRCSVTAPTWTSVPAFTVVVPVVDDVIVAVHDPVPPDVVQLPGPTKLAVAPPEFVSEKLIVVPFGAFTRPPPLLTLTCAVSVWIVPTGFVAADGVIVMLASGGGGPAGSVTSRHASPTSPPVLFWSPSCTMNCSR